MMRDLLQRTTNCNVQQAHRAGRIIHSNGVEEGKGAKEVEEEQVRYRSSKGSVGSTVSSGFEANARPLQARAFSFGTGTLK
jgi:hypothetical protein